MNHIKTLYKYSTQPIRRILGNQTSLNYVRNSNSYKLLDKYGYCIIPNYIDSDAIDQNLITSQMKDNIGLAQQADDMRIFGAEKINSTCASLNIDKRLSLLSDAINNEPTICHFTMMNYLESGSHGSSGGGWHRDSFYSQFKAMLYLTDVNEKNGPFQLLEGSHKFNSVLKAISAGGLKHNQNRISDNEVKRLISNGFTIRTLTGKKGDLILFNSTTIHRGKPIEDGVRLAATNYYFTRRSEPSDIHNRFNTIYDYNINIFNDGAHI